jgi:signal peptidase II
MTRSTRAVRGSVLIATVIVVLDQLTKAWALSALDDRDINLFWTLRFHLTRNSGMAFSRGEGLGPVIGIVALIVVAALLVSLRRQSGPAGTIAVGLVIGGAAGNVVDRLFRSPGWLRGEVIDFIDPQWWPIFNVADMSISIGGLLLVFGSFVASRRLALDDVTRNDVTRNDVTQNDVTQNDVTQNDVTRNDVVGNQVTPHELSENEPSQTDVGRTTSDE